MADLAVVLVVVFVHLADDRRRDCEAGPHDIAVFSLEEVSCPEGNLHVVGLAARGGDALRKIEVDLDFGLIFSERDDLPAEINFDLLFSHAVGKDHNFHGVTNLERAEPIASVIYFLVDSFGQS